LVVEKAETTLPCPSFLTEDSCTSEVTDSILKEGDANSKLFHRQACYRKKRNFISKLEEEGRVITNHDDMQEVLDDFFSNLLGANFQRLFTIDLLRCHRDAVDLSALDGPFLEKEVRDTVVGLPSDKAPRPDGFTGRFYKTCWNIIKVDLLAALNSLHQGNARKLGLLNSAYLILLPKRVDFILASDFRSISLIHSFAKLFTKFLLMGWVPVFMRWLQPIKVLL
jgi:hypothetical protein